MADPGFWAGQRILLTGHTGFKGAWLSVWLAEMGAQVFGFSLAPDTSPNLFSLMSPGALTDSTIADIRDRKAVAQAVELAKPTIVIHMAAQALVRRGYLSPVETFETNVIGTANLLEALRSCSDLQVVLVVTTDKVYRNLHDGRLLGEDDCLGAHDPYSASKAAAEMVASCWRRSYFANLKVPLLTARAGNVIGGGDWSEDRLVPDIWRAVRAAKPLRLRNPHATRPWQHVTEPLAGYLRYVEAAAQNPDLPESLNFGPDPKDCLTVAEVADALLNAMGAQVGWEHDLAAHPHEAKSLALDPGLALKSIGWRSRLTSRQAIAWTAEWYRRLEQGENAMKLCLEQLSRYGATR